MIHVNYNRYYIKCYIIYLMLYAMIGQLGCYDIIDDVIALHNTSIITSLLTNIYIYIYSFVCISNIVTFFTYIYNTQ